MNRAPYYFLWLTAIASTSPIGAQVPATTPTQPVVTAIPKTPAGDALRAWLDAFNSGDTALVAAYQRRYEPEITVSDERQIRERDNVCDAAERRPGRHRA